jgi:hypothetical protein
LYVSIKRLFDQNRAGLRRMAAAQLERQLPGQLEDEHELAIQDARITYYFLPAWGSSTVELKITALSQVHAPGSGHAADATGASRAARLPVAPVRGQRPRHARGTPRRAPLFAEVLQANPALAGAYKDIGDFYFRSFDTARAWRSWELARTLAPMFQNLEPVAQHERTLATRFPEYFQ